ncbi:MAG: Pyrophosphate--fructose 6-phosphate 1-phosphotransferase [Candidatus Moanabacter tarae]|uniref:Pyrophosphate--fructose 6-phosphate 1-phosphotransferase n=1 Tax=Candidatus Moanibacter tarae TaxID=2200854 RepID=A0A2Z4AF50_9BACT|nr:MAG: Pyrophosphate--fructose 6-phosphate 1-phosphotransferase [Candidatus Moanabacter tarae]|tara:strand:+ start:8277 stop:9542 length:1266 start_codon:yes stop_codon:yes gene_type:complete
MAEEFTGNCLVAQSGGPTSVINATLVGVISEALNYECIEEIYGGLNGVRGILNEDFVDLAAESQQTIRALRYTPASALGTCRYRLNKTQDIERIVQVFEAHNIRYFFYVGGNDSQETAGKISDLARSQGYELRVIGIPKTVDNDLVGTDHCPGYGSVAKYVATTVREIACDHESMGHGDLVSILEVMGRNAGWIAASAALAKRRDRPSDPPHLIYLPEVAFSVEKFLDDVQRVLSRERYCLVVVGEGLVDKDGNYIATTGGEFDSFGNAQLGGAGDFLHNLAEKNLGIKVRSAKLGITQRAAAHCSSKMDNDEAFLAGEAAVKEAVVNGKSDMMVTLLRGDDEQYTSETGLCSLSEVANGAKSIPVSWINEDGVSMNFQFIKYATPLIQGEVPVPYDNGVPIYSQLSKIRVDKLLGSYNIE